MATFETTAADPVEVLLVRKLRVLQKISDIEAKHLKAVSYDICGFCRGDQLVRQGEPYGKIYISNGGWAARERHFEDGRRQIVNFVLPGDFATFNACLFKSSAHTVRAITPMTAVRIQPDDMLALFARCPRLGVAIMSVETCEKSILEERIASLGKRDAAERVAHLFLELWQRLNLLGLADDPGFRLPLTQAMIGDAMGLSQVHVNRILMRLRGEGLIDMQSGRKGHVTIVNLKGLEEKAQFDAGFLHFT